MALAVEILYTADCTDWQFASQLVERALADLHLDAQIQYFLIETDRQALQSYFVGSPTIRINGVDLFPVKGATAGLRLRSYPTEEGLLGHPTYAMIHDALGQFVSQTSTQ